MEYSRANADEDSSSGDGAKRKIGETGDSRGRPSRRRMSAGTPGRRRGSLSRLSKASLSVSTKELKKKKKDKEDDWKPLLSRAPLFL